MNDIEYGDYLHYFFNYTYIADKKEDKVSIKKEIFKDILDKFETEEMRLYCEDMIEKMPEYVWTMKASTSSKYHNATQCQPGGEIYHILMGCQILEYLLGLEYMQNKYPKPKQRDALRVSFCLHDAVKCGWSGSQYTVHEHPILAAEWVEKTEVEHDIKSALKKYIGDLIRTHSGQYRENKRSSVVLPEIKTDEQFLIHAVDILSSRANLDMIYTDKQIQMIQSLCR